MTRLAKYSADLYVRLMGPRARGVLAGVSPADLSNAAHPFGTAREIEIGIGLARAHRVTHVGELGWESMPRPIRPRMCSRR
jgi:4-methylaminobutanoate oxidase (formaldehyde-forming)